MPEILSSDTQAAFERLADIALTHNTTAVGYVGGRAIAAVPDVVLVEYAAQGHDAPPTMRLQTVEGREVSFFALPTVDLAVAR